MTWNVPVFEPDLRPEEEDALVAVTRSKWLTMDDRTSEFERQFADEIGVPVLRATSELEPTFAVVG